MSQTDIIATLSGTYRASVSIKFANKNDQQKFALVFL